MFHDEDFDDVDGDGLWDPNEPLVKSGSSVDFNGNGQYDSVNGRIQYTGGHDGHWHIDVTPPKARSATSGTQRFPRRSRDAPPARRRDGGLRGLHTFQEICNGELPLVGSCIGESIGFHDGLEQVVDAVRDYFASVDVPTLSRLADVIIGLGVMTGANSLLSGGEIAFTATYRNTVANEEIPLNLGVASDDYGLSLDPKVGVIGSVALDFTFGVRLTEGLSPADAFFVRVNGFTLAVEVTTEELSGAVDIGFLEASITDGSVDLLAHVSVSLADPNLDGGVTLSELQATPLASLFSLDLLSSLTATLPISFSATVGGVSISGSPIISLASTDLFSPGNLDVAIDAFPATVDHSGSPWLCSGIVAVAAR